MKAFYVFLFLALIGMVFSKDIFNKQGESCPAPPPECQGLITDLLQLLSYAGCNITVLCGGGDRVAEILCLLGCCPN
ncbi:hypothetical protein ALC56_10222 [Trachymyrmex septentrionalis]|uniref:Uncharacterized protein n=1 Tax=Trachymyrmex septentrionalis TaxID=34720 RepID=A0A195F5D3_9HYME|nr:hypothetical protein ALC56_10222 [Trachymyrmex septentrionalis]